MSESLSQLQALVNVVVTAHANGETDAQFLARLDAQDAAEKSRLETEYPIDDRDEYAAVEAYRDAECDGPSTFYVD